MQKAAPWGRPCFHIDPADVLRTDVDDCRGHDDDADEPSDVEAVADGCG